MIRAGELRHRVTIQAVTETTDSMGGVTETWSDVATVWANIRPITGKEYFASGAVQADVTHYVTIRYYDGLTPKHRLVYDGRVFEIRHVLNIQERNTMQLLLAREIL